MTKILYYSIIEVASTDFCFLIFWLPRALFAGMLLDAVPNLVDPRGRLLPRSYDVLG